MPPEHSKAELEQQKEFAKVLFIKDKLTMEQLSVKIGVHYNTIKNGLLPANGKSCNATS